MAVYPPTAAKAAAEKSTGIDRKDFTLKDWKSEGRHAIFNLVDPDGNEYVVEGDVTPSTRPGVIGGEKWDLKVEPVKEGDQNG